MTEPDGVEQPAQQDQEVKPKARDATPPLYIALTTPTKAWSDTPVASP